VPTTVILSAARTPFGRLGGALAARTAVQLGTVAASAALQRADVVTRLEDALVRASAERVDVPD